MRSQAVNDSRGARIGRIEYVTDPIQQLHARRILDEKRFNFILPEIEDELYAYIGGIVRNYKGSLLTAGGTSNHSHLLLSLNKNYLVPDLIGDAKRESSSWIKTKSPMLEKFGWQDGYSAFSVGYTQIPALKKYIANQKEHHKQKLFEDEMRGFYRKYAMELMNDMFGTSEMARLAPKAAFLIASLYNLQNHGLPANRVFVYDLRTRDHH